MEIFVASSSSSILCILCTHTCLTVYCSRFTCMGKGELQDLLLMLNVTLRVTVYSVK